MGSDRATSKDPLEALTFMIETGFTVAIRGVYGNSRFHARAVKGEQTLVMEDNHLGDAILKLRDDARRVLHQKK